VLGWRSASGVRMSVQNELLEDEPEGFCNGLNLDLISETVLAFPHVNSKGEEPVREHSLRKYLAGGVVIEPVVRFPRLPVALAFGPIHCSRSNRFPRSVSKTLNLNQFGTVASDHAWLSGKRKVVSKEEQNSRSESGESARNNFCAFDGRDAISAMTLSTPGTWTVVRRPACAQ
jgi:hypothetical protein